MKLASAMIVSILLSSCSSAKSVDLSAEDTWLSPDEIASGRKLTFREPTQFYIRSQVGCLSNRGYKLDGSIDPSTYNPEAKDLYALIDGSRNSGDRIPLSQIGDSLRSDLSYYGRISPMTRAKFKFYSDECQAEVHGSRPDMTYKPSNIQIYFHNARFRPKYEDSWFGELGVQRYELRRNGNIYCSIYLGVRGNFIEKARIDVLNVRENIPSFDEAEPMDCVARGIFSAFGYSAVLRLNFDELYPNDSLSAESRKKGHYVGQLLVGFEKYQVDRRGK